LRSYHLGQAKIPGVLEDYAFFVWGLLELYQVSLNPDRLAQANRLTREMMQLFSAAEGGFYDSGTDAEEVLMRQQNAYDGAIPSGNSVAAMNLLRLGRILEDSELEEAGAAVIRSFAGNARRQPAGYLQLVMAHQYRRGEKVEVVLAGDRHGEAVKALLAVVNRHLLPGLVLRHADDGGSIGTVTAPAGSAAAFVCARGSCLPPAHDPEELERLLSSVS
jgi:uncharacterized protein YyaL (SSP411 family)